MDLIRQTTVDKIESLHAEIAELIRREKEHFDTLNTTLSDFWRYIHHTRIAIYRYSPQQRAVMANIQGKI